MLWQEHRGTRWESSSLSWDMTPLGQWCPLLGIKGCRAQKDSPPAHAAPQFRRAARSSHPAQASHPFALPYCRSSSKWGFIASCFARQQGRARGRALAGRVPPGRQDGLSRGGGCSSARSQLWPLAVNVGFLCSVSPGRGLFPGRKPGKSTLLKCSGGLCNGKPSGFAKQMPQIRVGGCKERPLNARRLLQWPTSPPSPLAHPGGVPWAEQRRAEQEAGGAD